MNTLKTLWQQPKGFLFSRSAVNLSGFAKRNSF